MKLTFPKDSENSWVAVATNEVYNGKVCEELLYAEIDFVHTGDFIVRFEDDFKTKHNFKELGDAQQFITLTFHKHTPIINGKTWDLEDEE